MLDRQGVNWYNRTSQMTVMIDSKLTAPGGGNELAIV